MGIKMRPCLVTHEGRRYRVLADGTVWRNENELPGQPEPDDIARAVRATVARLRARNSRRFREQAMRDLGLTKTPYGWE
jgi:hypothetical protein